MCLCGAVLMFNELFRELRKSVKSQHFAITGEVELLDGCDICVLKSSQNWFALCIEKKNICIVQKKVMFHVYK